MSQKDRFLFHFRNWLSLTGLIIIAGSCFAFLLLIAFDMITGGANPYVGILSYIVAPFFFALGTLLAIVGWIWHRRKRRGVGLTLRFDLSRARDRNIFLLFVFGAIVFMFITSIGSYQTYTYTNSNEFCGMVCHSVMEPQFVAYPNDAHAKVNCVDCHVGVGAKGAVKAKWHGIYKVYSLAFDKYPTPLRADPDYLPTIEESCLKCHENDESIKDVAKTYHHFLSDDDNTPFSMALRLKLGPDETSAAKTRGIHWHAKPENKVEFVTTTENPDIVPWVRVEDQSGQVTEYAFHPDEDDEIEGLPNLDDVTDTQTMDCLDCHSRPAHAFPKPNDMVEYALRHGALSPNLPELKYVVAMAMSEDYSDREEALAGIDSSMKHSLRRENEEAVNSAIESVQSIYASTVFPEMKADWRSYPDHIGHKDTFGCFRCHDDKHVSKDGSKTLSSNNCNTCHDVISQGLPGEMVFASKPDTEFEHPDGDYLGFTCAECHTGGLQLE